MVKLSRQLEKIEKKEKKGAYGQWRKQLCRRYARKQTITRDNALKVLTENLSAAGESISCKAGCIYCCYHYVAVSLVQGIVIVDHLYRNRALLKRFLQNYETWYQQANELAAQLDAARGKALARSLAVDQVIEETRPLSTQYLNAQIRCPFLDNTRCIIYPVRPAACSAHCSVSDPEDCAPSSSQQPSIRNCVASDQDIIETVQLADPRLSLYELTLPTMIFRLLTEGGDTLMRECAEIKT